MSPLPRRQLTIKEKILGEKKAKESTAKKLENINSLIEKKKEEADQKYVEKESANIIGELDSLWSRIHGHGAKKGDKEKINALQKRAHDLKTRFEQKAKFAEMKKDSRALKHYGKMLGFIEEKVIRRVR